MAFIVHYVHNKHGTVLVGKSVPWNWCLAASSRQSALAAVSRLRPREWRVRNIMSGEYYLVRTLCGVLSTTWAGQLEASVAGAEAEVEQGEVTRQRGVQAGEAGSAQQQGATCTHTAVIIWPPCTVLHCTVLYCTVLYRQLHTHE